jgi:hypothetical protein
MMCMRQMVRIDHSLLDARNSVDLNASPSPNPLKQAAPLLDWPPKKGSARNPGARMLGAVR